MIIKDYLLKLFTPDKTYAQKQEDSRSLDELLGFDVYRVEKELVSKAKEIYPEGNRRSWGRSLYDGSEAWIGLDPQQLQTTYFEFIEMIQNINPQTGSHFCDLGAGYGRAGIVLGSLYPKVFFTGLEIVKERVDRGNDVFFKNDFLNAKLITADLSDSLLLPVCDYYFIYDYGVISQINKTLEQLATLSEKKKIKVIARGRGVRTLIENKHYWLTVFDPIHFDAYSVYSS